MGICQFCTDADATETRIDNVGDTYLCEPCARDWDQHVEDHGEPPYRCTGGAAPRE